MTTLMIRRPSLLETFDTMFGPTYAYGERCMDVDVYEVKDELIVKAELSGVNKDSFDIRLDGDMLRIEAEKKGEERVDPDRSYLCEREFGRFIRTLSLPFPVDTGKVSSTYENGVLEIRLPKAEEAKSKHISVTVK